MWGAWGKCAQFLNQTWIQRKSCMNPAEGINSFCLNSRSRIINIKMLSTTPCSPTLYQICSGWGLPGIVWLLSGQTGWSEGGLSVSIAVVPGNINQKENLYTNWKVATDLWSKKIYRTVWKFISAFLTVVIFLVPARYECYVSLFLLSSGWSRIVSLELLPAFFFRSFNSSTFFATWALQEKIPGGFLKFYRFFNWNNTFK